MARKARIRSIVDGFWTHPDRLKLKGEVMDWNKMCSHDQEIARKLAATIGLQIDDNGVVHKVETREDVAAYSLFPRCAACGAPLDSEIDKDGNIHVRPLI
jgi:hypothetical protein